MAGTGLVELSGDTLRTGSAGTDLAGSTGEDSLDSGVLRGRGGAGGGTGTVRDGKVGTVRLGGGGAGGGGAGDADFGNGTGLAVGNIGVGVEIEPSRLGIVGGLPKGNFADKIV